ncbi:MAG: hypothetical protein JXR83_03275 [Deltaproteobacteria bacterium]|nr:hypothetical protein [Deltaproteobacteria bacterium]
MWRRAVKAECQASAIAALALIAAGVVALGAQRLCTSDGRAVLAAGPVLAMATPDDVLVVDGNLGRGERDRGRILFPFRPLPALASDTRPLDLSSFPFRAIHLIGEVEAAPWTGGRPLRRDRGLSSVELDDPGRLLVALYDPDRVAVVAAGQARPCRRPHHTGGVSCGPEAWHYVGPIVERLADQPRLCLWAHPPRDGAVLEIPLAIGTELVDAAPLLSVQLNFLDEVRGEEPRTPVALSATVGGRSSEVRCTNRDGACRIEVDLAAAAGQPVALALSTPNNSRQLVCLTGGLTARAADGDRP